MHDSLPPVFKNALKKILLSGRDMEAAIRDAMNEYTANLPEEQRAAAIRKVLVGICYCIIKNSPDYDALMAKAGTPQERKEIEMRRDKFLYWLHLDETNREAKEEAIQILFNEICGEEVV